MIRVVELTKRFFSSRGEVTAVDQLSFHVASGEVFGLLGPNGAGKTTTLRMIVGLLPPDDGYTEVNTYRTQHDPDEVKARIGLVSTADGVYPWLTVREMLLFFADLYGLPPSEAERNLDHMAEVLDIKHLLDRRCAALSTGQKQRVVLARGLIHDPPVMLLDEPTRGLDVIGSQVVFDYIAHLRTLGKAVIVSTHRLDEAERLCDRFGLMHQGRFAYEGDLQQLRHATDCERLVDMFGLIVRGTTASVAASLGGEA